MVKLKRCKENKVCEYWLAPPNVLDDPYGDEGPDPDTEYHEYEMTVNISSEKDKVHFDCNVVEYIDGILKEKVSRSYDFTAKDFYSFMDPDEKEYYSKGLKGIMNFCNGKELTIEELDPKVYSRLNGSWIGEGDYNLSEAISRDSMIAIFEWIDNYVSNNKSWEELIEDGKKNFDNKVSFKVSDEDERELHISES